MKAFHYPALDSTLTRAQVLARLHPDEVLLVSARTQSQGAGVRGRAWASPLGGAWFTIAWPARAEIPSSQYAAAPLVVGLAVLEALAPLLDAGQELQIKWPNDLLLEGRKLAGVLCERWLTATSSRGTETQPGGGRGTGQGIRSCLLIGVGINVNVDPAALGTELRHPATSILAATGRRHDLIQIIDACAQRIALRMGELERQGLNAGVRDELETRLAWRGSHVTLRVGDQNVTGICRGIDAQGALQLEVDEQISSFDAGEVYALSPASESCV